MPGRSARSPSIEKTPSVMSSLPVSGSACSSFFSRSSMSLCLYLRVVGEGELGALHEGGVVAAVA